MKVCIFHFSVCQKLSPPFFIPPPHLDQHKKCVGEGVMIADMEAWQTHVTATPNQHCTCSHTVLCRERGMNFSHSYQRPSFTAPDVIHFSTSQVRLPSDLATEEVQPHRRRPTAGAKNKDCCFSADTINPIRAKKLKEIIASLHVSRINSNKAN